MDGWLISTGLGFRLGWGSEEREGGEGGSRVELNLSFLHLARVQQPHVSSVISYSSNCQTRLPLSHSSSSVPGTKTRRLPLLLLPIVMSISNFTLLLLLCSSNPSLFHPALDLRLSSPLNLKIRSSSTNLSSLNVELRVRSSLDVDLLPDFLGGFKLI